ncbi:MAG: endonuclease MutS2 [Roseburia sp.]|nr:endonuclease MutS2 [Roseburia sp.]
MTMNKVSNQKLELDKILSACSSYACLGETKKALAALQPCGELSAVRERLALTSECDKLLFRYGVGKVEYFPETGDAVKRASKGAALSCGELLNVNALLRSARVCYRSVTSVDDVEIVKIKQIASRLYFDEALEKDISEKILNAEQVSDFASDALYAIRSKIKSLNERIRSSLSEYISGDNTKYLQDGIVTIRGDRYVIPVKAEYKSKVKGFVHDRSQSGATFFIEPEYVLNLNNELISLTIDEKQEVERILKALSARVGAMRERLETDAHTLSEIDGYFARAEYAYTQKAVCPQVNKRGYVNIIKGRHPLVGKDGVVPVSLELGKDYAFLLLSGANTGGKTVTLKMVGLFCLMAECGLFIPAAQGSEVCAFSNVFCDVGDSQSIEDSLSTFSSHMTAVSEICGQADGDSLVLIDELGGGTNPDEGQAIARAVTEYLLKRGAKGIITTHFTALKEFAYTLGGIENAAMQFDSATLKPLYSIKIGLAGASNALAVSRRLGMNPEILAAAESYLSDEGRTYDNILRRAEESRVRAQEAEARAAALEAEWSEKCAKANKLVSQLESERARLGAGARAESRRIINERTARAEELLNEIEGIFLKEEITQADLIRARTLKNRLKDEAYEGDEPLSVDGYKPATKENLKVGCDVFVESMQSRGVVLSFNPLKGEAEVLCGSMKLRVNISALKIIPQQPKKKEKGKKPAENVKVVRKFAPSDPTFEINVIGMTVEEALYEVENFIDKALTDNLEQVKIIHGVGTGKLRNAISARLKKHRAVKEFRAGAYGEGEIGVTIVTLGK